MLIPGLMAIFAPAVVGFLLGAPALAGLLIGALTSGFMLAVTMYFCEKGGLNVDGITDRGKGTPAHSATVVGDTVGDPFKDTSGPSLNILIKLMSIVALVLAPLFKTCCQSHFDTTDGIVAGIVLFTLTIVLCAIISYLMNKSSEQRKLEVDARMRAINGNHKPASSKAAVVPQNESRSPNQTDLVK
eukprot:GSMAST32.ASY1.ANO1.743.1 assembled CDS